LDALLRSGLITSDTPTITNETSPHVAEALGLIHAQLAVANTLMEAIQRTVQRGLPAGGSQTGGGGTAHRP
jgi:hypothetical protein